MGLALPGQLPEFVRVRLNARFKDLPNPEDFAGSGTDDTARVQAMIDYAAANRVPGFVKGNYTVSGLSLPDSVMLIGSGGQEAGASSLTLTAGANTYIMASAGYITNSSTANYGGVIRDIGFDGNKANQSTAKPLLVLRTYRESIENCRFSNSKGRGVLLTPLSANGTAINNGMAENAFSGSRFSANEQEGLYGEDGGAVKLSDVYVHACAFGSNGGGSTKKVNLYVERGAGWHISDNQFYGAGKGGLYIFGIGRTVIMGNHFDVSAAGQTTGTVNTVELESGSGGSHSHAAITGNLFHMDKASAGAVTWQHLSLKGGAANTIFSLAGNTFYSHNFAMAGYVWSGSGYVADAGNSYYQATEPTGTVNIRTGIGPLPTSAAGLASGQLWSNLGIVTVA